MQMTFQRVSRRSCLWPSLSPLLLQHGSMARKVAEAEPRVDAEGRGERQHRDTTSMASGSSRHPPAGTPGSGRGPDSRGLALSLGVGMG